ncbi:MAG: DUF2807 domain-containing protein [Planctomycetes bacterium]|nr:DUF2807 domain-containing protein [Planctomycetota bacterium]
MSPDVVQFGGGRIGAVGVLAGLLIALGLPAIVLVYGDVLGPVIQTLVILLALCGGGLVALVAAFFGTVVPRAIEQSGGFGAKPWCFSMGGSGVAGSGVLGTAVRELPAFDAVRVDGSGDAEIAVGGPQSVMVEADDNLLEFIRTEVRDGTLVVAATRSYRSKVGVRIKIAVPSLKGVGVAGSGDVRATGVRGKAFAVSIKGSGDVQAEGRVENLRVSIAGSGDADLAGLACSAADVEIAGSGDAQVNPAQKLRASVVGSGDIEYRGEPEIEKRIIGSGSVKRR